MTVIADDKEAALSADVLSELAGDERCDGAAAESHEAIGG